MLFSDPGQAPRPSQTSVNSAGKLGKKIVVSPRQALLSGGARSGRPGTSPESRAVTVAGRCGSRSWPMSEVRSRELWA